MLGCQPNVLYIRGASYRHSKQAILTAVTSLFDKVKRMKMLSSVKTRQIISQMIAEAGVQTYSTYVMA